MQVELGVENNLLKKIRIKKMIEEELTKKSGTNHQLVEQMADLEIEKAELNDQLTKAKQFIRDFLSVAVDYIDKEDKNYSLIEEVEQFLKETN